MKVVIIGGGAAGISTASNIRKYDENIEITVITLENQVAYSPCAIPYVLSGEVEHFEDIVMHQPEDYLEKNIKIITNAEVFEIKKSGNRLKYRIKNRYISVEKELSYDYLVIATGATSFIPNIEGTTLKGVFKIRTIEDGFEIKDWAEKSSKAVVVGAGLIGLETAYGLKKMGLDVTVTEMLPQIIPRSLDPDMAKIVQDYMENQEINTILGHPIEKIAGKKQVEKAVFGEDTLDTDMVIMATGIRPQIKLAKMAGCKIGRWAILVNEKMQTSVSNIYAVGDCVEVYDALTKQNTQSPLGTTAVRQGKIAAKNITGVKAEFKPVLNAMVSKIGGLEFGAVGSTKAGAIHNGIEAIAGKSRALTKARYYPGAKRIDVKMICTLNGKIIGCQIVAEERVAERIDTMSLAISLGVTCSQLASMEFSYAPPLSMVIDPIILAAEDACEKLKRLGK
ncbi:MAG TPA: FAD-dependent oxidoreductase [Methanobacterium sp.]|nr:FAD-dependent oxidoreductase [Methanobacterium sp.]